MLSGYSNVTERLKKVAALAEASARSHAHDAVDPAYLALALIDEGEGVAATALHFHGFSLQTLRKDVERLLPPTLEMAGSNRVGLPDDGHAVLNAAHAEAVALGHRHLGTKHLLLGLLSDSRMGVAQLFEARAFPLAAARARIRWILESDPINPSPYISEQAV